MHSALITGGSRGIGRAIKELFESRGLKVYTPSSQQCNLANPQSIAAYTATLPRVDILINCAGINKLAHLEEADDALIQEMFQVNMFATMQLIKAVVPQMKQNNYGRIVNFSSIWCRFSKNARVVYSSAKASVSGLSMALGVELSPYGILTNAIAPGFINTEMTAINNAPPPNRIYQRIFTDKKARRAYGSSRAGVFFKREKYLYNRTNDFYRWRIFLCIKN